MSNGHQFRQDMHKHAAQHKHQFDAFGQNARNSARAATERHQATSRAWAQQAAQNAQQGYDDIRRRSEAQARRIGHQPFEAWPGDDPRHPLRAGGIERFGRKSAARRDRSPHVSGVVGLDGLVGLDHHQPVIPGGVTGASAPSLYRVRLSFDLEHGLA